MHSDVAKQGSGMSRTKKTFKKSRGFVPCQCGAVLQYITKALAFMVNLRQGSELVGICSTSYTSKKNAQSRQSRLLVLLRCRVLGLRFGDV